MLYEVTAKKLFEKADLKWKIIKSQIMSNNINLKQHSEYTHSL